MSDILVAAMHCQSVENIGDSKERQHDRSFSLSGIYSRVLRNRMNYVKGRKVFTIFIGCLRQGGEWAEQGWYKTKAPEELLNEPGPPIRGPGLLIRGLKPSLRRSLT